MCNCCVHHQDNTLLTLAASALGLAANATVPADGPSSPIDSVSPQSSSRSLGACSPSKLDLILRDLRPLGEVSVLRNMAILSLVGKQMRNMVGGKNEKTAFLSRLFQTLSQNPASGMMFTTLAEKQVNIEMISQGYFDAVTLIVGDNVLTHAFITEPVRLISAVSCWRRMLCVDWLPSTTAACWDTRSSFSSFYTRIAFAFENSQNVKRCPFISPFLPALHPHTHIAMLQVPSSSQTPSCLVVG